MREMGAFEAKNKFGHLLDQVERGEEVVITRRGRAIAKIVPAGPGFDRADTAMAVLFISYGLTVVASRQLAILSDDALWSEPRIPPIACQQ